MSLLELKNVHTYFYTKKGIVKAVNGVSFELEEGRTLGVVGESGSGKSQTAMSILKLFEENQKIVDGEIWFEGEKISDYSEKSIMNIRGNKISMIFQEPMTSLNPVFKVSRQLSEVFILHQKMDKKQAYAKSIEMLEAVGIPNAEKVAETYPFQLSGGMRQRVMIAMALACKPKLLIADEPTTALDVTIQAQILKLMNELKTQLNTAILFVTHNLGVINEMADDVAVMYCGQIVEKAPTRVIFSKKTTTSHPYTEGLMKSIPSVSTKVERLDAITGVVPHPLDLPKGCRFAPRCKYATEKCQVEEPDLLEVEENHFIRCFYPTMEDKRNG